MSNPVFDRIEKDARQGYAGFDSRNPQAATPQAFGQPMQGGYLPKLAAIRIAENIPANFGQLGKLRSFKKFGHSLTMCC